MGAEYRNILFTSGNPRLSNSNSLYKSINNNNDNHNTSPPCAKKSEESFMKAPTITILTWSTSRRKNDPAILG